MKYRLLLSICGLHLWCPLNLKLLPTHLSVEQRDAFKNLLTKYGDIFSKSSQDMGLTDLAMHKIETGNARPIKQHPRRIPLAKTQDVEREIKDMLARGH